VAGLPSRLQLEDEMAVAGGGEAANESKLPRSASLCSDNRFVGDGKPMAVHERTMFGRFRHDEPVPWDQLTEGLAGGAGVCPNLCVVGLHGSWRGSEDASGEEVGAVS
jgi:hypothetical protein